MSHISAADLAHGIKGATFPIRKRELAEHARQNRAPDEIVEAIRQMPAEEFDSITEVEHAFSRSQGGRKPQSGGATQSARKGSTH